MAFKPVPFLLVVLLTSTCAQREPDRFVSIDGKDQHILDLGSGEPVVVFVSGFGSELEAWGTVQQEVSKFTRTIAYDRAGVGKSELTVPDRSLEVMVDELNRILEQENIQGPYILVGHSFGGYIIRYFVYTYPDKVAGMILVDPSVEYMDNEIRRLKTPAEIRGYDSLIKHGRDPSWPEGVKMAADYYRANELKVQKIRFPKNKPITLLTAMPKRDPEYSFLKGTNNIKLNLHKRWLTEAPQIRHIVVQSGHFIQYDHPELVIGEIRRMAGK